MKKLLGIFSILILLGFATSCNQKSSSSTETNENVSKSTPVEQVQPVKQQVDPEQDNASSTNLQTVKDIKPEYITAADFKAKIWDYENDPEAWTYKGDIPCIVDFYADWCKPCKMVAPIMDDLADYYDGRVKIYKVDTDKERELATVFQIKSIPAILFAPGEGKPAMQPGALSKEEYIRIIDEFVLKIDNKNENNKIES